MLNDRQLDQFKKQLLAQRRELLGLQGTRDEAAGTVELDQTSVGRLSRMDALQGQAMSVELKRRQELQLGRISAALQRMEQGEFGECLDCGEVIAPARLQLDPATPLCVVCAGRREQRP